MKKYDAIIKFFKDRNFNVCYDCYDTDGVETVWINATTSKLDLVVIVDADEYLLRDYHTLDCGGFIDFIDYDDIITRKTQSGILFQIERYIHNI